MSSFPLPADVLPHRPPFLFVDEITEVEPGVSAAGTWHLTGDEWFFAGHFPGRPTPVSYTHLTLPTSP
jgi:3-hydroxyacyl-[acyl-carrier-protein] dehydratase